MASFSSWAATRGQFWTLQSREKYSTEGSRQEDGGCQSALVLGFQYTGYCPLVTDFDSKDLCGHSLFTEKG